MSGFFLAVEGIDGTGKSSLIEALAEQGFEVAPRRFEENYARIKAVRARGGPDSLETIQALYLEGISEISELIILPGLINGKRFVADRWLGGQIAANLLHQQEVARRGIEQTIPQGIVMPDLCIYLYADDSVRRARIEVRGELTPNDRVSFANGAQALYRTTIFATYAHVVEINTTSLNKSEVVERALVYFQPERRLP